MENLIKTAHDLIQSNQSMQDEINIIITSFKEFKKAIYHDVDEAMNNIKPILNAGLVNSKWNNIKLENDRELRCYNNSSYFKTEVYKQDDLFYSIIYEHAESRISAASYTSILEQCLSLSEVRDDFLTHILPEILNLCNIKLNIEYFELDIKKKKLQEDLSQLNQKY